MKKLMLIGAACLAASSAAFADLGDTYAQSCAKWGGRGTIDKAHHRILWRARHATIVEIFVKNECVSMRLVPEEGFSYKLNDIQRILPYNCGAQQIWMPFPVLSETPNIVANWATTDDAILAALYNNGCIQLSYKWYLKDKGLLVEDDKDQQTNDSAAPVEDGEISFQHLKGFDQAVPELSTREHPLV